jgi:hypothetical protein
MESPGVLLEMLEEFLCIYLVKERGTIFKLVDVDFFDRGADEFLAAIFDCLPNTIVFSVSLVDGFGFFQFYQRCIFGNFVVPQAKVLWDRKCNSVVVCFISCVGLDNADDMVDTICSVVGNGLKYVEELFFQSKKVVVVWLADDGQLGVKSIL